jgi:hypothetical protein
VNAVISASARSSAIHAPHLRLEDAGRAQLAGNREVQQLVIRNTAPQEER